ncbi:lasso peptide biosynthesis protein [Acidithiobacillus ferrooxidans]|jgi:hypothetical protein|nr:lasso peptide biosynthesis protein [Acidithiobacillus ferrooxidans]MBU2774769.1 hypothetical protein [Acidithiobacillus ferrooxidans]MBU2818663.1 hypothetical protein [Acidithiobacillus ferrooxidans]MCR0969960.1 lasso peptide biosynthesis protein [Acidithiobacillus ferrooxidans]MCR1342734.1 lasso peptide biosynthesis protein [Acidithiobacillus ferrooxidans]MCR1347929.1 lasso peptide biosynthesis protein [Acidithiobacillus ferrooxidans]
MGQAKRRGSKDDRIAEALRRFLQEEDLSVAQESAIYSKALHKRDALLEAWQCRAEQVPTNFEGVGVPSEYICSQLKVFNAALKFIWKNDFTGACHNMSAVIYIILSEINVQSTLCIGEVKLNNQLFDHSWVEVGEKIIDAAVSLPLDHENSAFVGGPVFRSVDLSTNKHTRLHYGVESENGLDSIARNVCERDLAEFGDMQIADGADESILVWNMAKNLASDVGLSVCADNLRRKYGSVNRVLRSM